MFKNNNKVLPDIILLSTSLEYVEYYVVKCKTTNLQDKAICPATIFNIYKV